MKHIVVDRHHRLYNPEWALDSS